MCKMQKMQCVSMEEFVRAELSNKSPNQLTAHISCIARLCCLCFHILAISLGVSTVLVLLIEMVAKQKDDI